MGILGVARHNGGRSAQLTRQRSRAVASIVTASVALLVALLTPSVAHADPEPSFGAIEAPTLDSPANGAFLGSGSALVRGTKAAGSEVQILAGASRTNVCTVQNSGTEYSCLISRLPSGPSIALVAVQLLEGSPNLESARVEIDVLAEPTISSPPQQLTSGLVHGTGYPGARITLSAGSGSGWTFPVGADGSWAYVLPRSLGSGPLALTATQSSSFSQGATSNPSPVRRVVLDVDAPVAPRLTAPAAGSVVGTAGTVFSGTGEDEATVEVFAVMASGADLALCTGIVSRGVWRCTGAELPAGTATVTAFQRDVAGNVGGGSTPIIVQISGPATATPQPAPSPDGSEEPAPAPVAPVIPSPTPPSTPQPVPSAPGIDEPGTAENWVQATPFTTGVPSAATDLSWLRALLLAAVAILLLLVPARMLATTIGSRRHAGAALSLTGRNRVPTHDDPAPLVSSPSALVTAAVVVITAAGIVLFANPVYGQPEYLRVFFASVAAVALLNVVASLLPRLLAPRLARVPAVIALSPRFLLSVAAVALFSRVLELQPALLFGVVFTVTAVAGSRPARGRLALVRIGVMFVFGLTAWLVSTLIGAPAGFTGVLAAEIVNIAAVAGVGSAAILLIPLGRLDGRALLIWSRPAWFAAAVVVLTVLFALLAPVVDVWQSNGAIFAGLFLLMGFGALGFSLWLWRRVIQPNLSAD